MVAPSSPILLGGLRVPQDTLQAGVERDQPQRQQSSASQRQQLYGVKGDYYGFAWIAGLGAGAMQQGQVLLPAMRQPRLHSHGAGSRALVLAKATYVGRYSVNISNLAPSSVSRARSL